MYFDQAQFGKRLKEFRLLQGMTQEKMAEVFHCTTDHVGRMERGREGCSIDLLVEMAVYFHVSTDYLLKIRKTVYMTALPYQIWASEMKSAEDILLKCKNSVRCCNTQHLTGLLRYVWIFLMR